MVDMNSWLTTAEVSEAAGGYIRSQYVKLACNRLHKKIGQGAFKWCAKRGRDWYVNPEWPQVKKWFEEADKHAEDSRRLADYDNLLHDVNRFSKENSEFAAQIGRLTAEVNRLRREQERLEAENARLSEQNRGYERRLDGIRRANAQMRSSRRFKNRGTSVVK